MPATLTIPHECCKDTDLLDQLLDIVHDLGGAVVAWGAMAKPRPLEKVYVSVAGLPGHASPLVATGSTLNSCCLAILCQEWPDPADQAGDEAG